MYAIIEVGGQQSKVEKGTKLEVGRLQNKVDSSFQIHDVLLLNDNGKITIGTPLIKGAYVEAKVLAEKRSKKILVYKMKPKKRYRRTIGSRQDLSEIEIIEIKTTGGTRPEKLVPERVKVAEKPVAKTKAPKKAKVATEKKTATKKAPAKKTTKKAA